MIPDTNLKTVTEAVPPTQVSIIGTGDGNLPPSGPVLVKTQGTQPDIVITVVGPLRAIGIRFINQYLTTLVGLVGAGLTPAGSKLLEATDFYHLILTCGSLAVAGAGFGLLKDLITVFGRLEGTYPLLTGNV